MSDKKLLVIHPSHDAKLTRAVIRKLERVGYLVIIGDPTLIKAVDIEVVTRAQSDAIARAAYGAIRDHPCSGVRSDFATRVIDVLAPKETA